MFEFRWWGRASISRADLALAAGATAGLLRPRRIPSLPSCGVRGEYDPLELKRDLRLVRVDSGFRVGSAGSSRVVIHFGTSRTEQGAKIRVLSLRMVNGRAKRLPGDTQPYILVLLHAVDAVCRRSRGDRASRH